MSWIPQEIDSSAYLPHRLGYGAKDYFLVGFVVIDALVLIAVFVRVLGGYLSWLPR
jgi:hypothetical protein